MLVDRKLHVIYDYVLTAQKANCIQGCFQTLVAIRSREAVVPLCPALVIPCLENRVQFSSGAPNIRKTWTWRNESRGGPGKGSEDWSISSIVTKWDSWD